MRKGERGEEEEEGTKVLRSLRGSASAHAGKERNGVRRPTERTNDEASRARGNDIPRPLCVGAMDLQLDGRLLYLMLRGSLPHRNLRPRLDCCHRGTYSRERVRR